MIENLSASFSYGIRDGQAWLGLFGYGIDARPTKSIDYSIYDSGTYFELGGIPLKRPFEVRLFTYSIRFFHPTPLGGVTFFRV